jgi:hypothetical protein
MTDLGTFLFTFRVEGNRFLNATCVKLEHTSHVLGIPTALFSRNEFVFRGDSNSVVVMYNTLKKTASPSTSIGNGPLLGVVKIPGEDNYIVQFADSLVLWDFVGLKKVKTLHPGHLKTLSVAVLNDWVAYIPKGSNGVRLLPLDPSSGPLATNSPTISQINFPYFMNSTEKALKYLTLCEDKNSTILDLLKLTKEFGTHEEYSFWNIVYANCNQTKTENANTIDVFCDKHKYKDVLVKTAQCVWAADFQKREEVAKILLWSGIIKI